MAELVRIEPTAAAMSLADATTLAKTLAASGLMPDALKGKPSDILVVLLTGKELGLGPMQAVRSINVIKGKATMSAELMVALCKRSPDCEFFRLVESTPTKATFETKRRGDPEPTRMSYTIEDAKAAQLVGNPTWQKHPAAMLRARCQSALSRAVYPDMLLGVYSDDEGEEIARGGSPSSAPASSTGRLDAVLGIVPAPEPEEQDLTPLLQASIEAEKAKKRAQNIADTVEALEGEIVSEEPELLMEVESTKGHFKKGDPAKNVDVKVLEAVLGFIKKDKSKAAFAAKLAAHLSERTGEVH